MNLYRVDYAFTGPSAMGAGSYYVVADAIENVVPKLKAIIAKNDADVKGKYTFTSIELVADKSKVVI